MDEAELVIFSGAPVDGDMTVSFESTTPVRVPAVGEGRGRCGGTSNFWFLFATLSKNKNYRQWDQREEQTDDRNYASRKNRI